MTETVGSLSEYARRFDKVIDPTSLAEMGKAAGMAAKAGGLSAAAVKLGPDRAMSNFRNGRVRLGVGFDYEPASTQVVVNHRPGGVWVLASEGRKGGGVIYPRSSGRKSRKLQPGRAVKTPWGYRASSSYGRSRGSGVIRMAAARERDLAPKAAAKALTRRVAAIVGTGISLGNWGGD